MPAIVEMRLRPSRVLEPTTRQLHGLACAVFEGAYSANHVGQDKQFTIWPLHPDPDGWLLRASWLPSGLPHSVLAACGQLRIGPVTCAITDLAFRPALHADLASGPSLNEARLTFRSPTYFSQNGTHVVQPDPRLIVGSWAADRRAPRIQPRTMPTGTARSRAMRRCPDPRAAANQGLADQPGGVGAARQQPGVEQGMRIGAT
jgi:hypothetical protein